VLGRCLDGTKVQLSLNLYSVVRFETFTAVAMKNVVFWDIKAQFVLHRKHITSPLQRSAR
jgi:hypothetical protein